MNVTHEAYTTTALSILAGDRLVIGSVKYLVHGWKDEADRATLYSLHVERKQ